MRANEPFIHRIVPREGIEDRVGRCRADSPPHRCARTCTAEDLRGSRVRLAVRTGGDRCAFPRRCQPQNLPPVIKLHGRREAKPRPHARDLLVGIMTLRAAIRPPNQTTLQDYRKKVHKRGWLRKPYRYAAAGASCASETASVPRALTRSFRSSRGLPEERPRPTDVRQLY
jgi:hypothetical protein